MQLESDAVRKSRLPRDAEMPPVRERSIDEVSISKPSSLNFSTFHSSTPKILADHFFLDCQLQK
jgi:hypothetical protein